MDVLILGIGNILWADEGFGVRAAETLQEQYAFDANVTIMDGGTQGLYLIQHVQECDVLVVFDAIDYGLAPGEMRLIQDEQVPKFMGAKKMSLHQTGFQEVLQTAELIGQVPKHILLIGVQPVELEDYGGSLRPEVKAQIAPAIAACLDYLAQFGVVATKRSSPLPADERINAALVGMRQYEENRPSEQEALRTGDDRVLNHPKLKLRNQPLTDSSTHGVFVDGRKHFE